MSSGTEKTMNAIVSDIMPPVELVTAVFGFAIKDGKLLLGKFNKATRKDCAYDMVGGHVEKDESIENALSREFIEEVSVKIKPIRLLGHIKFVEDAPKPEDYKYPYPESYMLIYKCDIIEELDFKENNESVERVYFGREELKRSKWCSEHIDFIEQTIGKELC
ncbi:MAG: hypothetical protein JWP09_425 [Candidatus Taylorbacteria bacterium]|nr:hypothetical protein [Candidatus Taylorbacteria bacterium]